MMGINIRTLVFCLAVSGGTALVSPGVALAQGEEYFVVQESREAPLVSLGGTVIPHKEVTLSAQIPGRVKFLAGIEGDAFRQGDQLVAIDDSELTAQRNAAIAQWNSAQAQLRNANVQYSRELWSPQSKSAPGGMGIPNLFDQMFTRPMEGFMGERSRGAERGADLYSSGTQIAQAQSTIARVEAEIQAIDAKLRDARSMAPFDGVITKKYIEVGDTMQPGQPLIKYADVQYLQVEVDVPARLRPGLTEGMELDAELDVGKVLLPVRVRQIYPMADAQRHTIKVKLDLPINAPAEPGMYAKVMVPDLNSPAQSVPVIPSSAIRYHGSLPGVYVINDQGGAELRMVREGKQLRGGYTTVLSGVQVGERVMVNPGMGVSSGWSSSEKAGGN